MKPASRCYGVGSLPLITITGKTISPATNVPQNFTSPVTYTVTADDGSQQSYTVIVSVRTSVVYIGSSNDDFFAIDAVTGIQLWQNSTAGEFYLSNPVLVNGTIYVGCGDNNLYAFDAVTGATVWKFPVKTGLNNTKPVVASVAVSPN